MPRNAKCFIAILMFVFAIVPIAAAGEPTADPVVPNNGPQGETLVTLHLKDVSAHAAFIRLGTQTGLTFIMEPEQLWETVTAPAPIDADSQPLVSILNDLYSQCGLEPRSLDGNTVVLARNASPSPKRPSYLSGPLLFFADKITRTDFVDFGAAQTRRRNASVRISYMMDPTVRILGTNATAALSTATDDRGESLLSRENRGSFVSGFFVSRDQGGINLFLNLSEKTGKSIAILKGTISLLIQLKSATLEVPDVLNAKNVAKEAGDFRVTVTSCGQKTPGSNYEADIVLECKTAAGKPSLQGSILSGIMRHIQLQDDAGHSASAIGLQGASSMARVSYHLIFTNPGFTPTKMVLEIPIETRELTLPFEFHDLPLPLVPGSSD